MVAFKMQIGDLIDSENYATLSIRFCRNCLELFMPHDEPAKERRGHLRKKQDPSNNTPQMQPQMPQEKCRIRKQTNMETPSIWICTSDKYGNASNAAIGYTHLRCHRMDMHLRCSLKCRQDVNVAPASFQPFSNDLGALSQKENIDLIMDVPLEVSVELGRTTKSIKDILEFSPGTIVELRKLQAKQ